MKVRTSTIIWIALSLFKVVVNSQGDGYRPPPPCACPDVWAPVCGEDQVVYGNSCEATCAGTKCCGTLSEEEAMQESCVCKSPETCPKSSKDDCFCTAIYDPVFGSDGKVYGNSCEAKCAGAKCCQKPTEVEKNTKVCVCAGAKACS